MFTGLHCRRIVAILSLDQFLPDEHAGLREGRCTTDQVTLLTGHIEAGFERNYKCGALFIDLSAAYDTVCVIPVKSLVNFIKIIIASRSFIMHVGADRSKQIFLKNGVPQSSVLAPLLFNLYTSYLPKTQSKKYIYADDIALMISGETFGPIEQSLSEDLDNMSLYFNNWRLKINTGKTVCTNFHLTHRLAKYQLQITCEGQNIPHEHRRTGRGVRGQWFPPQFGQFVDINSGRESTLFGQNTMHV